MRILIGSQNFGYSTEHSDTDWMEFVYPTWDDIAKNHSTSIENILDDNTHIKIYDIRKIRGIVFNSHFSQMQFMFSKQYIDCDDLQYFIENRQTLCRVNLFECYLANSRNMISDIRKKGDPKTLTRAHTFYNLLCKILSDDEFQMYDRDTYYYRIYAEGLSEDKLGQEGVELIYRLNELQSKFEPFRGKVDTDALDKVHKEIIRLLKLNVR